MMVLLTCRAGPGRDLELDVLSGLVGAGFRTRVIPQGSVRFGSVGGGWDEFSAEMTRGMDTDDQGNLLPFINVVCFDDRKNLARFAGAGVLDVAVVSSLNEVDGYDLVVRSARELIKELRAYERSPG